MTMAAPRSEVMARPRFEGSNICTWIGFKHVMYLIEEAVLNHLRERGLVPRQLYEDHGLCVEIVDSDVRIPAAIHMDDLVRTRVTEQHPDCSGELVFRTETFVASPAPGQAPVRAATATVRAVFRANDPGSSSPSRLAPYTVAEIARDEQSNGPAVASGYVAASDGPPVAAGRGAAGTRAAGRETNAFVWRWRVPYFYCHFSQRMQHSGYVRLMEEVVDLFLAERGISIRTMLDRQSWIPVVPRARVAIVGEALMEDEMHTVFTVEEIFKNLIYTARMDCYVRRDGQLRQTATGRITHGYAAIVSRRDWKLVPFDERTMTALRRARPVDPQQKGPHAEHRSQP